jgi:hypothetical protein
MGQSGGGRRMRTSVYSFRHSFKDMPKAVETPEELIDE